MARTPWVRIGGPDQPLYAPGGIVGTMPSGTTYYVDSVAGNNGNDGRSWQAAKATLRNAYATAAAGDTIYVAEGHAENLLTVLTLAKAGLRIIGEGEGDRRPAFTVTGAVDGLSITAADVLVENIRFVTPSAAATADINIASDRAVVRGVGFAQGANLANAITITAAGELPLIEDCDVIVTANGPDAWVRFEGVVDRPIIRNNYVIGASGANEYDDGVIDFNGVTAAAGTSYAVTNPVIVGNVFLGADDVTPLTAIANSGSVVGDSFGPNTYAGGTTNADTVGVTLQDDAITAAKIAANAIGASEIADNAIDAGAIATGAITAAKFAAGAIDAAAIANAAIDAATFAAGAIDAAAIAAGAIDAATFAAGAIDAAAIADAAIDAATFAAGAIDAAAIAAGAIDAATFAAGAIDAAAIADAAIDAATFAAGAIDAAAIANGAIDAATFAAGAIDAAAIADNAIDTGAIALSTTEKTTDGVVVTRAAAALPQTANAPIFTVTGLCLLKRIVGYVTVQVGAVANATKLTMVSTGVGADTDLCATLDINGDVADSRYEITGTFINAMVQTIDLPAAHTQATELVVVPGTINLDCAGNDGGTGRVRWSATYVPLESGAQIVAA